MEEMERAVIGDIIPLESLRASEKEYERKVASGTADDDAKFKYAWHLVKCGYKSDIRKGISMMAEMCRDGIDQRDFFYFMGLGYYKLEEYQEAERCVDRVLNMEPKNLQARQLKKLILEKMKKDDLIAAGMVGGAVVVGAVAIGAIALLGAGIAKLAKR